MDPDAVTSSYARWAPIYDRTFGAVTRTARRAAVEEINRRPGTDVLEVGVGTGLALTHYDRAKRVTGIDFSDEMLQVARRKVTRERFDHVAMLRQMDARVLDFPDASFDIVAAMHLISVVPEPERVMAEMTRVLRPGGHLVLTNHFARETGALAKIERGLAPFANTLGWHSDFERGVVTETRGLKVVSEQRVPPLGMMTLMVLERV